MPSKSTLTFKRWKKENLKKKISKFDHEKTERSIRFWMCLAQAIVMIFSIISLSSSGWVVTEDEKLPGFNIADVNRLYGGDTIYVEHNSFQLADLTERSKATTISSGLIAMAGLGFMSTFAFAMLILISITPDAAPKAIISSRWRIASILILFEFISVI
jgi:hypothetical protein